MKMKFSILLLFMFRLVHAGDHPTINIVWTDTGVYMNRPEVLLHRDDYLFAPLPSDMTPLDARVPRANTITIPMPEALPDRGSPEFQRYIDTLANGIFSRLRSASTTGGNFEIRTVQDITIKGGYLDPFRQEQCVRFAELALRALQTATDRFQGRADVHLTGMAGSNGGYVATEALNRIGRPLFERLFLVDARAYTDATLATSQLLGGRVTIVNTGGDAPAFPDMIAHLAGAGSVHAKDPRVQVIYIDPDGWNWAAGDHLALFAANARATQIKTLQPSGVWSKTETTDIAELRQRMLETAGNPGGVSLTMEDMQRQERAESAALRKKLLELRKRNPEAFTIDTEKGGQ